MYRFFPAQSRGNDVIVYDPQDTTKVLETFSFPRQETEPFLCLADYLRSVDSGEMDYVGFLVVTAGAGISELAREWRDKGDYLRSHALQAAALETAEGFAERVHHIMRDVWGIPDRADMTMQERFGAKYVGQRFSFGYPACPDLDDQQKLFALMKPQDIGVELTEGSMMEPEASVSAIVFAHPEARYFNVEKV
jgi:5-methyltetrahydrofolate--homocysteine methyltransferase